MGILMRMRGKLYYLTMVLAGLAAGFASAWFAVSAGAGTTVVQGPWATNPLVGSAAAGLYDRARVAHYALLGLTKDEAVYFIAKHDSDGQPLTADKTYRISGGALPGRWWSITAYGEDFYLIPNEQDRYSFNSETASLGSDGDFEITVSRSERSGDWLPLGDARGFDLTLRLYDPHSDFRPEMLPRIEPVTSDE